MLGPLAGSFLTMIKGHIPEILNTVTDFIPSYLKEVAEKNKVEKVLLIMDLQKDEKGKEEPIIKYMTLRNGSLEILKKEDGSPYVEKASVILKELTEKGLSQLDKAKDEE